MTQRFALKPIGVFFSYSHRDEALRDRLEMHLSVLKRQGVISGWHDRRIGAGTEWKDEIDRHIREARIILLLVSVHFIASDYCYGLEMQTAMQRHAAGVARVIPVILRPTDWQHAPFGKLQAVPTDGKPVTRWADRDQAFLTVVQAIRGAAEEIGASGLRSRAPAPVPN